MSVKIVFSGGGTLGPVTPLLALSEVIQEKYPDAQFLWVGTKKGPERPLIEQRQIPFRTISSGKFRRYISVWNVTDIARIGIGFFQSLYILWREQPSLCISAGGFISVPLHWAAWFLGIPTWIHQQDVRVGLANRLMAPVATKITTALEQSVHFFPKKKTQWLGNPIRQDVFKGNIEQARKVFQLDSSLPVVFATGGGTGSMRVNQLVVEAVQHLKSHAQIIHLTGKERPQELAERAKKHFDFYHVYQFFSEEMPHAYACADVVISRGGFGTITELAALGKPAILIPKPGHQVENVSYLKKAEAVILLSEQTADGYLLAKTIQDLLEHPEKLHALGARLAAVLPPAKKEDIVIIINELL